MNIVRLKTRGWVRNPQFSVDLRIDSGCPLLPALSANSNQPDLVRAAIRTGGVPSQSTDPRAAALAPTSRKRTAVFGRHSAPNGMGCLRFTPSLREPDLISRRSTSTAIERACNGRLLRRAGHLSIAIPRSCAGIEPAEPRAISAAIAGNGTERLVMCVHQHKKAFVSHRLGALVRPRRALAARNTPRHCADACPHSSSLISSPSGINHRISLMPAPLIARP